MKHIKSFENNFIEDNISKYKKGDYVLLDLKKIKNSISKTFSDPYNFKDDKAIIKDFSSDSFYPYNIEFYDFDEDCVTEKEIKRLLTEKEIESFNLKRSTHKYNL